MSKDESPITKSDLYKQYYINFFVGALGATLADAFWTLFLH